MKTIIAGCRHYRFSDADFDLLDNWLREGRITEVVSGGATGTDEYGRQWAISRDVPVKTFTADWARYGDEADAIRNRQMAEYADALIAFWDGHSAGTKNMIETARALGLGVAVRRTDRQLADRSLTQHDAR